MTSGQDNIERFDKAAEEWEEKPQRVVLARKVSEAIRQAVPLNASMRVLEYGCGTGLVARSLSPLVSTILAVDTSAKMLEVLRRKTKEENIANIETLAHDLTMQPLPAQRSFTLALSSMTLHHINDTEALLRELLSVISPGGHLAVADLVTEDGSFHDDNGGVAHFGIDPEAVRAILKKHGGSDIGVREIHTIEKPRKTGAGQGQYPVFLVWCRKA